MNVENRSNEIGITVVIPLYNKEDTIRRALLSVVQQSVLPVSVIVVDDGSTDGGLEMVIRISESFPFVQWIRQKKCRSFQCKKCRS